MKKIKYLYIDDEFEHAQNSAIGFNGNNIIITVVSPTANGMDVLDTLADYDGTILDLRLDDNRESNVKVNIRGTSIAQEIRTRATEGSIRDLPIILFSADSKLLQSYNKDSTSHDLFDYKISKDDSKRNAFFEDTRRLLAAYAQAYNLLHTEKSKRGKHIFDVKQSEQCDQRFIGFVEQLTSDTPIHDLVRIVKNEINNPGVLIDETWLATRLGADKMSKDWESVKKSVQNAQYSGILSDYYPRWWMHLIYDWWEKKIQKGVMLENLTATDRVNILKERLKLTELTPLKKLENSRDNHFWTVCCASQAPLTAADGIRLLESDKKPWQEAGYISAAAYFQEVGKGKTWKAIDGSEKMRVEKLKKYFAHERRKK